MILCYRRGFVIDSMSIFTLLTSDVGPDSSRKLSVIQNLSVLAQCLSHIWTVIKQHVKRYDGSDKQCFTQMFNLDDNYICSTTI